MPFMAGGSCHHIMRSAYPLGFTEAFIATVLRDTLNGLDYLHQNGHIHRDVKVIFFLLFIVISYMENFLNYIHTPQNEICHARIPQTREESPSHM
jgi:serine/threonine protein kinase